MEDLCCKEKCCLQKRQHIRPCSRTSGRYTSIRDWCSSHAWHYGDDSLGHGEFPGVSGATGLGQQREGNVSDGGPAGTSCFIILTLVMVHIHGMMFLFISPCTLSPGHTKRTSGNYLIL